MSEGLTSVRLVGSVLAYIYYSFLYGQIQELQILIDTLWFVLDKIYEALGRCLITQTGLKILTEN